MPTDRLAPEDRRPRPFATITRDMLTPRGGPQPTALDQADACRAHLRNLAVVAAELPTVLDLAGADLAKADVAWCAAQCAAAVARIEAAIAHVVGRAGLTPEEAPS